MSAAERFPSIESCADVVATAYDAVASAYDAELRHELDTKPLDRALLTAFAELAGPGRLADVGCGPGQVARFLAGLQDDVIGIDLSPRMIDIAQAASPAVPFRVGSMLDLPAADGVWAGAVAFYSIIHLSAAERPIAWAEFARVLRPNGWLLVAFHVDGPDVDRGDVTHLATWFGEPVDLDFRFLEPDDVFGELETTGFAVRSSLIRDPAGSEYPSHRCYLLAQKR